MVYHNQQIIYDIHIHRLWMASHNSIILLKNARRSQQRRSEWYITNEAVFQWSTTGSRRSTTTTDWLVSETIYTYLDRTQIIKRSQLCWGLPSPLSIVPLYWSSSLVYGIYILASENCKLQLAKCTVISEFGWNVFREREATRSIGISKCYTVTDRHICDKIIGFDRLQLDQNCVNMA